MQEFKILKKIDTRGKQYLYLEDPDNKSNVIEVVINSEKNLLLWDLLGWDRKGLLNLEVVDLNDTSIELGPYTRCYYKGCTIEFESDRDTWVLTAMIDSNLDIDRKEIDAGSEDSPELDNNIKKALATALDLIDKAILKKSE